MNTKTIANWRLAGIHDAANAFQFTQARYGIAAKGEPSTVLQTLRFDSRKERDAALTKQYDIPIERSLGAPTSMALIIAAK